MRCRRRFGLTAQQRTASAMPCLRRRSMTSPNGRSSPAAGAFKSPQQIRPGQLTDQILAVTTGIPMSPTARKS
jgi:hypothetical protein